MRGLLEASESQIEVAVCHLLRVSGFFFWKQANRGYFSGKSEVDSRGRRVMVGNFRRDHNPYVLKGVPDLILVHQGRIIGFEIKSKKGIQSKEQKEFAENLIRAGGLYYLIRSIEDAQIAIREILNGK